MEEGKSFVFVLSCFFMNLSSAQVVQCNINEGQDNYKEKGWCSVHGLLGQDVSTTWRH
jgi:hypothetical protein